MTVNYDQLIYVHPSLMMTNIKSGNGAGTGLENSYGYLCSATPLTVAYNMNFLDKTDGTVFTRNSMCGHSVEMVSLSSFEWYNTPKTITLPKEDYTGVSVSVHPIVFVGDNSQTANTVVFTRNSLQDSSDMLVQAVFKIDPCAIQIGSTYLFSGFQLILNTI